MVEQKFTRLEDGRIKWEHFKEEDDFSHKDFGKVGKSGGYDYIIFDSKEQALSVLDQDLQEVEEAMQRYEEEMQKNTYDFAGFDDKLSELVQKVAELHTKFDEVSSEKMYDLYKDNPQKYKKLLSEFNKAKDYIKDEMGTINNQYQRYLSYKTSKQGYDFYKEQYDKIVEQRQKLMNLPDTPNAESD